MKISEKLGLVKLCTCKFVLEFIPTLVSNAKQKRAEICFVFKPFAIIADISYDKAFTYLHEKQTKEWKINGVVTLHECMIEYHFFKEYI